MNSFKIRSTVNSPPLELLQSHHAQKPQKPKPKESSNIRLSSLNRGKSERNFLSNFRKKSGVLIRLLQEQAKEEINLKNRAETLQKIEEIKTKNDFFSARCGLKKEFASTGRLFEKTLSPVIDLDLNRRSYKDYVSSSKKSRVPISFYNLDPNLIPDYSKKPITFEDLEVYMQSKIKPLSRYF